MIPVYVGAGKWEKGPRWTNYSAVKRLKHGREQQNRINGSDTIRPRVSNFSSIWDCCLQTDVRIIQENAWDSVWYNSWYTVMEAAQCSRWEMGSGFTQPWLWALAPPLTCCGSLGKISLFLCLSFLICKTGKQCCLPNWVTVQTIHRKCLAQCHGPR